MKYLFLLLVIVPCGWDQLAASEAEWQVPSDPPEDDGTSAGVGEGLDSRL